MSHPSRVRGLKFKVKGKAILFLFVAPFTGAWIEIQNGRNAQNSTFVAPFTGAWIEIQHKYTPDFVLPNVAPFTGAWIEIVVQQEVS